MTRRVEPKPSDQPVPRTGATAGGVRPPVTAPSRQKPAIVVKRRAPTIVCREWRSNGWVEGRKWLGAYAAA